MYVCVCGSERVSCVTGAWACLQVRCLSCECVCTHVSAQAAGCGGSLPALSGGAERGPPSNPSGTGTVLHAPGAPRFQIRWQSGSHPSPCRETPHLWGAKPVLSHFFSISSSENRSGEQWSRKGTDAGTRGGPGVKQAEKAENRGAEDEATQRRNTRPVQGSLRAFRGLRPSPAEMSRNVLVSRVRRRPQAP